MKSFLINIFAFLTLSGTLLYGFYQYSTTIVEEDNISEHYLAASIDRHARLATLDKPRVIFMGSSNLAFGLDSEYMEHKLERPVANLGLHGALGLDFIVKETLSIIEKGDVVVISIPYYLAHYGNKKLLYLINRVQSESKAWTSNVGRFEQLEFAWDGKLKLMQKAIKQRLKKSAEPEEEEDIYHRNAFNEYGDVIAHTSMPVPEKRKPWSPTWDVEGFDIHVKTLTDFYEKAQAKGVTVYMVYPAFIHSMYEQTTEELAILEDYYAELPFEVLGKPEDFAYPDSLFFDTVYHLNKNGRKRWNEELAPLIQSIVHSQ